MPVSTLVSFLGKYLKPTESIATWSIIATLIYLCVQLNAVNTSIATGVHRAETQHAVNVLKYAFKDSSTEADYVAEVRRWHAENRPAQIGAVQTLCDAQPNRLNEFLSPEAAQTICRLIR